jgi:ferredoxin
VRVAVDSSMCEGHAQCSAVCPSVFTNDELGYAVLIDGGEVPPGDEEAARLAVESCPEQAISIAEA